MITTRVQDGEIVKEFRRLSGGQVARRPGRSRAELKKGCCRKKSIRSSKKTVPVPKVKSGMKTGGSR